MARYRPWAVINTAGYVRVPDAEREPERCFRENAEGAANLAAECARLGIPFVTYSSDLVFDGRLGRPYVEDDAPCPTCVYGASKAEAEQRVLVAHPQALVLRTSAFSGRGTRIISSFKHCARWPRGIGGKVPPPLWCRRPMSPTW